MIKRFVARLLIITQIYSNLFQGFAATMTEVETRPQSSQFGSNSLGDSEQHKNPDNVLSDHPFTHLLYSEIDDLGGLHLARGRGVRSFQMLHNTPYNPADSFEYDDITADSKKTYLFQGLEIAFNIAFNADGVMVVEGCQDGLERLFLGSNRPIILNSVEARDLSLTAPRIVTNGISTIDTLRLQDIDGINTSTFVNPGQLTAKELFLKNLKAENTGGIVAKRFAVDGQLASSGVIETDELILEESTYLRLNENSSNDIKTLFLSKASHFENHASINPLSISILDGSGGSLTNLGTMAIDELAADSTFQSITNRHCLGVGLGTIQVQQFENHSTFMDSAFIAKQSDLRIVDGQNLGALKTKSLQIKTDFTNALSGVMDTSLVSGSGHLTNRGLIETQGDFGLDIKRFSNSGLLKALAIDGSSALEQFDNAEDGVIEVGFGINFTDATQVNNFGKLQTEDMALYSDKTLQKGELTARTLNIIGGTFLNQGEIEVDHLTAENGLINQASLVTSESTAFGVGGLTNERKAKAQLKGLGIGGDTRVINHGKLVVEGVDTALGILQITNSGVATINDQQMLPKLDDRSPENLARIATTVGPVTWGNYLYSSLRTDHEFENQNGLQAKISASKYLKLFNALSQKQPYVYDYANKIDPEFSSWNGLILKQMASRQKMAFIKLYESEVAKSQSEGSLEEQVELQQYLKQFEPHYRQIFTARNGYAKTLPPAMGTALVVESSSIPAVKLQLLNHKPGELTLKSGRFEFVGNTALVNDGTLIQDSAYTLWLTNVPGEFNRGTWKATGSLGLLSLNGSDLGCLQVEDVLHVDGPAIGSKVLRGQIETADFSASGGIELFGSLVTHKSTHLPQGLNIAADAVAHLKGLKLIGGEIINQGSLKVIGIDPTQDTVIKLTNSGVASIDNGQLLPKASEHSPENLARIATTVGPVTWENYLYSSLRTDHEFENQNGLQAKISASKYLRLFNALSQNQPYVYDYAHKIDPAITNLNGLVTKQRGSSYKKAFIERYQKDVVRSTTEGSLEEQAELQQYLKQFEPHYKQIFTARTHYAKTLHPAMGAALVVESSSIPAVKLQLLNQTPGKLTLKSGRFEFIGNNALVNDGSLIQDGAYTLWLTSTPGDFSQGVWQVKGSLGLLGYVDAKFADLEVKETLFIDTKADALKALASLANVKATKVSISALGALGLNQEFAELYPTLPQKDYETELFKKDMLPKLYTKLSQDHQSSYVKYIQSLGFYPYPYNIAIRDAFAQAGDTLENWVKQTSTNHGLSFAKLYGETERQAVLTELAETFKITYPWALEILLSGTFTNAFNVSAPELKVKSQILKTSGNLFSTQAVLELLVTDDAEISASIGGQAGINLSAKKLKLLGRADIPGAVRPNVCYKRNDNGLYAQGPVILNIAERLDNQYGVIQGSSYTIKAPQLINLAGLITATDPSLSSTIAATEIKNLRDEQRSYLVNGKCGGHASMNISAKNRNNYNNLMWCDGGCNRQNTTYETSDEGVIFAQGDLTLNYHQLEMLVSRITSGGKLTLISGDKQFTYENAPDIKVLPGTTTMTVRNLHGNHVVAKQDLHVELGNANMATSMQGQNIFVNAGMLTLQSLGVQHKSQGKIVNLLSLMQGGVQGDSHTSSTSNIFKTIGNGDGSDYTDLTLPFKHQSLPTSLVILGQDARSQLTQNHGSEGKQGNQGIDLQATMRSLEQAMGSQFYTLYRGINGLGLNIHHFFNATSDFVRGHKDTITQRRSIKSGETEQEVDVQLNPTLTPQDLLNSGILGVFLDFTKNIQGLESTHKALDDVNQTKQKSALMFAVPADHKKNPGINSPGVIELTSKDDLGVFTNVKGKDVKLVSTDGSTTVGSETIRHQFGHNYHDQLIRTRIEAQANLLIQGKTDVVIKAIETHSGVQTDIIAQTGMVLDQSLATIDHTVSYSYDKKSSTTTKVTNVHQNVSSHSSDGKVNIKANTGILQYGAKNINTNLDAPIILQEDVHDQRMVESHTISLNSGSGFGRFIGAKERKETNFSESISRSKGCHNSGDSFIAMAKERFKAVNPTFSAKHNEITADEIELKVGTNTHQSHTQSSYQGAIWNKVSQSTENHVTHRNPTFEHNIYLHSPKVILERVRGSMGTFDKIISDSEIITRDVDDIHQSTHKSQKSLSGGASLILSLAVSLATANPFTASSLSAAMLSAGYGTLCSQAAICLVEKDGDPGKAMNELGRRDIGKTMFMSMATAGLTKGLGDKLGITNSIGFENLAKKHLLQSAINTSMAVAIDGQNFEKAMLQGVTSAAINTLAAYGAGKIGDLRDQSNPDRINSSTHKLLHGALGGISGGISSQLSGGKFARGALSGAFGGIMGETLAELTGNKQLADLLATSLAFGTGLDSLIAYQTSSNATEYNWKKHQPHPSIMGIIKECTEEDCAEEAEGEKKAPKRSQKQEADERRRAKNKAELVKFFSKSLSPVRHDTVLQTEVTKPVKKFIGSMVPDTFKELAHKTGESLGKKAEKSSKAWQDFKQNPSVDNWSTKHALRLGAFETLGALGTGVEYVKAYGRRGLRGMGMDANTAQDTMSVVDGLLMFAGGTKAVSSLGTLSKQTLVSGPKLANKLSEMTKSSGPKIKAYVKDQFNYREHFAAERLRLEGGGLNLPKAGKYFDAEDALGLKPLSTEQPWVVRAGQEWKTKVFGRGQNTQTEGHAFRSYREAIDAAKREDVEAVFLNRGIRKVTNHPIEKPNTRPDVTIRRVDGKIDQIEVPSKSDVDKNLMARMNSTKDRLPECMKGEVDIRRITEQ